MIHFSGFRDGGGGIFIDFHSPIRTLVDFKRDLIVLKVELSREINRSVWLG